MTAVRTTPISRSMMMRYCLLSAAALLATAAAGHAAGEPPLMLQSPALSRTHVAFAFAGDLWLVDRDGGDARRLTSGAGLEFAPHFSPDGQWIAFTGEYDGN